MSWTHLKHKLQRSVKKNLRRIVRNPAKAVVGYKGLKSVYNGIKKNRWKKNIKRYLPLGGNTVGVGGYTYADASPQQYIHSGRTLSQLTGGA